MNKLLQNMTAVKTSGQKSRVTLARPALRTRPVAQNDNKIKIEK